MPCHLLLAILDVGFMQSIKFDINLLENIIERDRIITDPGFLAQYYLKNTLGIHRHVIGAIQLRSKAELIAVLRIANEHHVKVYPISTGNNWGYGCALPIVNECLILDLSAMNGIVEFNRQFGIVTIEPGVTQQQLYEFLIENDENYFVPTTGAGPNCSLIGNILERGYGLAPICDHSDSVYAIEAVLADGSIYNGSFPAQCTALNKIYHWSVGPNIDALLLQSNFAIITQMSIKLIPKSDDMELISLFVPMTINEDICYFLQKVQHEIGSTHMSNISLMNMNRFLKFSHTQIKKNSLVDQYIIKHMPSSGWLIFFAIYGNKDMIKVIKKTIRKSMCIKGIKQSYLSEKRYVFLNGVFKYFNYMNSDLLKSFFAFAKTAHKAFSGIPTEDGLKLVYRDLPLQQYNLNPSKDDLGIVWFSPLVPIDAVLINKFIEISTLILKKFCREKYMSFTSISSALMFASVPILYDKHNEMDCITAHQCYKELFEAAVENGFYPYRLGIQSMPGNLEFFNEEYWTFVSKLKLFLDPNNTISPGRYALLN